MRGCYASGIGHPLWKDPHCRFRVLEQADTMRRAASESDTARQFLTRCVCLEGEITFELDTKGGRRGRSAAAGGRKHRRASPRTAVHVNLTIARLRELGAGVPRCACATTILYRYGASSRAADTDEYIRVTAIAIVCACPDAAEGPRDSMLRGQRTTEFCCPYVT